MKIFIFLAGITLTGLIAVTSADKNISGTWILQSGDNLHNQPVLRIEMGEGIWKGKIDIPEQEVYDRDIHSVRVNSDSVFITIFENGPVINARLINDSTIQGEMIKEGRLDRLKFKKADIY